MITILLFVIEVFSFYTSFFLEYEAKLCFMILNVAVKKIQIIFKFIGQIITQF